MRAARDILARAEIDEARRPTTVKAEEAQGLLAAFRQVRIMPPPTDCLSPIEDLLIKKGLSKAIDSRFVSTITRSPAVASGNPFQVEVGLIFGIDMPADGPVEVLRFANRVPLMYQQGGCLLTKAIESVDWKKYGLDHPGGRGIPKGPAAILIHLASTNVQFTSEAKEAVSDNEDVLGEFRLALQEVGRGLRSHKRKSKQREKAKEKFELVNVILPAISEKVSAILGREEPPLAPVISNIMNAVFLEETTEWDPAEKVTRCSLQMFNYTARPRQYTLLATWPEREGIEIVDESREGKREAKGLRKWKMDTLPPGENVTVSFALDGLTKGDWTEFEVFFRGAGDIIGATKLDEKLLEEIRREEEAGIERQDLLSTEGDEEFSTGEPDEVAPDADGNSADGTSAVVQSPDEESRADGGADAETAQREASEVTGQSNLNDWRVGE
jgi:DNA topoisomerase-6 subunit B